MTHQPNYTAFPYLMIVVAIAGFMILTGCEKREQPTVTLAQLKGVFYVPGTEAYQVWELTQ